MPKLVTVYTFLVGDRKSADGTASSSFKATRQAIEKMPGATVIEASAEDVDPSAVDEDGRYRPKTR
jgi:hypothetical protein